MLRARDFSWAFWWEARVAVHCHRAEADLGLVVGAVDRDGYVTPVVSVAYIAPVLFAFHSDQKR
jgi:hypothetical protein